jgi:hypothetical protein
VGKLHRRLGRRHAAVQVFSHVEAATRRKRHGGHLQAQIVQQLAKLPDAGLRHLGRRQFVAGVDLDAVSPQPRSRLQGLSERLAERAGLNADFDVLHDSHAAAAYPFSRFARWTLAMG